MSRPEQLTDTQLQQLRWLVRALGTRPDATIPMEEIAGLARALGDELRVTVDLDVRAELGAPLVVLAPSKPNPFVSLSPREREIAALIGAGLRNRDIAARLGIALGTVKDHVHAILRKTGLRCRAAVAGRHPS